VPAVFFAHRRPADSPCGFCTDQKRDDRLLCVVEGIADELAIERTREYRGRYHVLHGVLSPLEGVGPDQLRIRELLVRLESGVVEELIVATTPTWKGKATALYFSACSADGHQVTRLAQGIPMGGDLEVTDQATLARAISARRDLMNGGADDGDGGRRVEDGSDARREMAAPRWKKYALQIDGAVDLLRGVRRGATAVSAATAARATPITGQPGPRVFEIVQGLCGRQPRSRPQSRATSGR